jgi:hypothetical protein
MRAAPTCSGKANTARVPSCTAGPLNPTKGGGGRATRSLSMIGTPWRKASGPGPTPSVNWSSSQAGVAAVAVVHLQRPTLTAAVCATRESTSAGFRELGRPLGVAAADDG